MMRKSLLTQLLVAAVLTIAAAQVAAATYDLSADWSDVQNPFGVWSLRKSPTALFTANQADYYSTGTNQRAWSDEPFPSQAHVPLWMKLSTQQSGVVDPVDGGTVDQLLAQASLGDILVHGAEFGRTGTNQTSVVFTSPSAGVFTITGRLWQVRDSYRQMTWQLRKNGTVFSSGTIVADGTYTFSDPFDLSAGTGGLQSLSQSLGVGDQVELALITDSTMGELLGMRFAVSTVPEPSSLAAVLCGLVGLAGSVVRRTKP